eukprot:1380870-Pyramimonas_sp.AAC.1
MQSLSYGGGTSPITTTLTATSDEEFHVDAVLSVRTRARQKTKLLCPTRCIKAQSLGHVCGASFMQTRARLSRSCFQE